MSRIFVASKPLIKSWGLIMLLDGLKTSSNSFFLPHTISLSSIADSIAPVIPHLLNPLAVYISGVFAEYLPIYGISSRLIQSCAAQ